MDRLRPSVRTCALTGFLCLASGTQAAKVAADARLHRLLPLGRAETAGPPFTLPITARSLMASGQGSSPADDRIRTFGARWGRLEAAMIGERVQPPHRDGVWDMAGFDRTSGRAFGLGFALPLAADISLTSEALVTRLKHRLADVPAGAYVRPANRALIGFGIAGEQAPRCCSGTRPARPMRVVPRWTGLQACSAAPRKADGGHASIFSAAATIRSRGGCDGG